MLRAMRSRYAGVAAGVLLLMLLMSSGCTYMREDSAAPQATGIMATAGPCLDAEPDSDADGLTDACEGALSSAFAPLLMMHSTRCTLPSAHSAERVPGGYFHAAQPVHDGVRLVYMPAYYRDCGWEGVKCILVDCSGHVGDSELIVVDVRRGQGGEWLTDAVFLSAHCFGRNQEDCRWYRGHDLDGFEWVNGIPHGAPVVWVSDARNANYPSYGACERGHFSIDGCDPDSVPYRFPVAADHNIGSRAVPFVETGQPPGCASGAFVEPADGMVVAHQAFECFWTPAPFRGWQGFGSGATAYEQYLTELGL